MEKCSESGAYNYNCEVRFGWARGEISIVIAMLVLSLLALAAKPGHAQTTSTTTTTTTSSDGTTTTTKETTSTSAATTVAPATPVYGPAGVVGTARRVGRRTARRTSHRYSHR